MQRTSCPLPRFRPTECPPETVDKIATLRVREPRSTKSALTACHPAKLLMIDHRAECHAIPPISRQCGTGSISCISCMSSAFRHHFMCVSAAMAAGQPSTITHPNKTTDLRRPHVEHPPIKTFIFHATFAEHLPDGEPPFAGISPSVAHKAGLYVLQTNQARNVRVHAGRNSKALPPS